MHHSPIARIKQYIFILYNTVALYPLHLTIHHIIPPHLDQRIQYHLYYTFKPYPHLLYYTRTNYNITNHTKTFNSIANNTSDVNPVRPVTHTEALFSPPRPKLPARRCGSNDLVIKHSDAKIDPFFTGYRRAALEGL